MVECMVGGAEIDMVLNTGCQSSTISEPIWALIKVQGAKVGSVCKGSEVNKIIKAFGQVDPIETLGSFEATFKIDKEEGYEKFYVVNVKDKYLLGAGTAKAMQLIKMNVSTNHGK